jgi:hypothetical protein
VSADYAPRSSPRDVLPHLFSIHAPGIVALCDLPDCANPKELSLRSAFWAPDRAGVAYVQDSTTIILSGANRIAPELESVRIVALGDQPPRCCRESAAAHRHARGIEVLKSEVRSATHWPQN